jgi:hypothetical protein
MPIFDALVSGYIITSYVDIYVSQKQVVYKSESGEEFTVPNEKTIPYYEWPSFEPIQFHPIHQAPNHPQFNGADYPKWISPWSIKTPPGYSCLFLQPVHRPSIFSIFPGVVDTDSYYVPVNFPFVLNDVTFTGFIPAGTPIAQVIPFKRDSWEMSLGSEKELNEQNIHRVSLRTRFFDSYKNLYRKPKEYK